MVVRTEISQSVQIDSQLRGVFAPFPDVALVLLFGFIASCHQRVNGDFDIAVATDHPLSERVIHKSSLKKLLARPTKEKSGKVTEYRFGNWLIKNCYLSIFASMAK